MSTFYNCGEGGWDLNMICLSIPPTTSPKSFHLPTHPESDFSFRIKLLHPYREHIKLLKVIQNGPDPQAWFC